MPDFAYWKLQAEVAERASAYRYWAQIEGRLTAEERREKARAERAYDTAVRALERYKVRLQNARTENERTK